MCIAILNPAGRIPENHLKNSWDNNNQGGGMLYNFKGKLTTFKTYDYQDFLKEYKRLRGIKSIGNIVLHFRIATSGHELYTNLHPFIVNDALGFVHNGIITGLGNEQHSDTYQFNEYLKLFKHDFLNCPFTVYLMQQYIGWSKLIFLDDKDKATIIGEESGKYVGTDWYSNDSYEDYNDFVYFGNNKVLKGKQEAETIDKDALKYLKQFYTNVSNNNIFELCRYMGIDAESPQLISEIDSLAYHYNSFDIVQIIERNNKEFQEDDIIDYYDNDNELKYTNKWQN